MATHSPAPDASSTTSDVHADSDYRKHEVTAIWLAVGRLLYQGAVKNRAAKSSPNPDRIFTEELLDGTTGSSVWSRSVLRSARPQCNCAGTRIFSGRSTRARSQRASCAIRSLAQPFASR